MAEKVYQVRDKPMVESTVRTDVFLALLLSCTEEREHRQAIVRTICLRAES